MDDAKLTRDAYFSAIAGKLGRSRSSKLEFYYSWLLEGLALKDKLVLDVGAGPGWLSFCVAAEGAREVISLEPDAPGAASGSLEGFRDLQQLFPSGQVRLLPTTLQDFNPAGTKFDLVLLHNVINHLDETACARLHVDKAARGTYRAIFAKLYDLMTPGAFLIISDASKHNFWGMLHIKMPFTASLAWEKHQTPRLWRRLLQSAGFTHRQTRWSSPSSLRGVGRVLFGHPVGAFFFSSHFCLTLRKDA